MTGIGVIVGRAHHHRITEKTWAGARSFEYAS